MKKLTFTTSDFTHHVAVDPRNLINTFARFYREVAAQAMSRADSPDSLFVILGEVNDTFLDCFDRLPFVSPSSQVLLKHGIEDIRAKILEFNGDLKDWVVEMVFDPASTSLPLHRHPGLRILTCRKESSGIFVYATQVNTDNTVRIENLRSVKMVPGRTVIYPANTPHTFYTQSKPFKTATYHGLPVIVPFEDDNQFSLVRGVDGNPIYPGHL